MEVVGLQRWHGWCHTKLLPSRCVLNITVHLFTTLSRVHEIINQIQCIYSFIQGAVCQRVCTYAEKLLVIILEAKRFCKQYCFVPQIVYFCLSESFTLKKVDVSIKV